jgi:ribonuclease HII
MLHVGIDEVGYGPKLGPLVVTAACARGPLRCPHAIADSKKVFSQARGVGTLEPVVLGYLPAATFAELLGKLSAALPDAPWYRAALPLPAHPPLEGLVAAYVRFVDPAEFNAATRSRNKSEFLFELAADLVNRVRRDHPGPAEFHIGKQGGRAFYLRGICQRIDPTVTVRRESRDRSTYGIPGATLSFLKDAEDRHELVALASMIGKYVRECAMRLFNEYWASGRAGLRRTAGYGSDGSRFWREIEPALAALNLARESVLRLR